MSSIIGELATITPLIHFKRRCEKKLNAIDAKAIVAQRLKRTPAIVNKLQRFTTMKLSQMYDIGGLRAVVGTLKKVRALESNYRNSRFKHLLVGEHDYIKNPKSSGYRSVHLIYKYKNDTEPAYDGLFLELQIRTNLQHAWATAVETMGTFLDHALKSSEGPEDWLNFFSMAGSAMALLEKCPPIPQHKSLSEKDIFEQVAAKAAALDVRQRLHAFSIAINAISTDRKSGSFHLIILDPIAMNVRIQTYGRRRLTKANSDYTLTEKRISQGEPIQAVLVSAGSIEDLKRAYPNYFLDTRKFIEQLDRIGARTRAKKVSKKLQRTARSR